MINVSNENASTVDSITDFTIMSYNCLASNLAKSQYFPKSDPVYLDFGYRSKLFEGEFKRFDSDIVCVQEMNKNDFQTWLLPYMIQLGYAPGLFSERGGTAEDGVSTFYKRDKFSLLHYERLGYSDYAEAQYKSWKNKLPLEQFNLATYNAALFCNLKMLKNNKSVWIVNTHINWNTAHAHTQLFQVKALLTELVRLNQDNTTFVIVGDFNSKPESIVVEYLLKGYVETTSLHYKNVYDMYSTIFDSKERSGQYLAEKHSFKTIESAYNEQTFQLPFTSRIAGHFEGSIDWIWYQKDKLKPVVLLNALNTDDEKVLQKERDKFTLPNEKHPSDHLPIMVKFQFLSTN
ncbi:unnamed protein product [Didymodactylos carnosus]|uniref:Endonuclease/exonuclease/phosphatase domain-containing protein n=1 Tax=Didymodactylos carnosus TaxID=1234261 RepID=A0A815U633_9BILA|nr:unnamed protein product [Didymodactylos carnosus]CAF1611041.1 unnamed protein product [Didymodactylos carnosus]CAF4372386.1 unnamed protein product [Didymodactylos carnosus]CAF4424612.1 unnamed protein product [Didymodactylos carnosus]